MYTVKLVNQQELWRFQTCAWHLVCCQTSRRANSWAGSCASKPDGWLERFQVKSHLKAQSNHSVLYWHVTTHLKFYLPDNHLPLCCQFECLALKARFRSSCQNIKRQYDSSFCACFSCDTCTLKLRCVCPGHHETIQTLPGYTSLRPWRAPDMDFPLVLPIRSCFQ